jgi:hypothetical protein
MWTQAKTRLRNLLCLAAFALPAQLMLFADAAHAQVDCSAGFNCGRVAYGE